jgi:hypothetical protein
VNVADSHQVAAVQFADLAAYTINRFYHVQDRGPGVPPREFDQTTMELLASTAQRRRHLLDN